MLRYRSRNGDNLKLVTSQVSGGHPYLSTGAGHIGGQGPYAQGPCRSKNPAINASYIRHTYIHTCAHTYTPAHTSHTYVVMCAHTCACRPTPSGHYSLQRDPHLSGTGASLGSGNGSFKAAEICFPPSLPSASHLLSGTLSDCSKKIAFSDRDLRNAFPENSAQIN